MATPKSLVTPNYQSNETLPVAICEASGVPLDPEDGWSLDIDRVKAAIKPNTKLTTINVPHNPTGTTLPQDRYMALIELCREHGIYFLHDEIFKMERMKHYLSVCNSGPSEQLSRIALKNKDQLLRRNCEIVDENLPKGEPFLIGIVTYLGGIVRMDHAWRSQDTRGQKGSKISAAPL